LKTTSFFYMKECAKNLQKGSGNRRKEPLWEWGRIAGKNNGRPIEEGVSFGSARPHHLKHGLAQSFGAVLA
jgi:hypothetical protein